MTDLPAEPQPDCPLCPRLAAFRHQWQQQEPGWFNGPVPCFGPADARLLVVGLAPGLRGANRTGRPFTGDYAGELLYGTLLKFGFASGSYGASPEDGLELSSARIANAVRCVPPENKPTPAETRTCNRFLSGVIAEMAGLRAILCLGRIAHDAALAALGEKKSAHVFGHGASHEIGHLTLFDRYHCSRYNTNTGRLTAQMFEDVFERIRRRVG